MSGPARTGGPARTDTLPGPMPLIIAARRHQAHAQLRVNGGHALELDIGIWRFVVDRGEAEAMRKAMARLDDATVVATIKPLVPAVGSSADVQFLRRALDAFAEELAFEDRRGEARTHLARKHLETGS